MKLPLRIAIVQSAFGADDYRSSGAFAEAVGRLSRGVAHLAALHSGGGLDLVAFPELTGMWLPLLAHTQATTLLPLATRALVRHPLRALRSILTGRGLSFVFGADWERHYLGWIEPFRQCALDLGAYVCPGSMFLPLFDWETARGRFRDGSGVYNTSYLISPTGRVLGATRKVRLTRSEVRLGIRAGSPHDLLPYRTRIGSVGIVVCYDGFHREIVNRLDRQGCEIVLQPSANPQEWYAHVSPEVTEQHQWLGSGLGSLLQGAENLRVAINPMGVSEVLGHRDEGRSSVFVNTTAPVRVASWWSTRQPDPVAPETDYPGLGCLAGAHAAEEILLCVIEG